MKDPPGIILGKSVINVEPSERRVVGEHVNVPDATFFISVCVGLQLQQIEQREKKGVKGEYFKQPVSSDLGMTHGKADKWEKKPKQDLDLFLFLIKCIDYIFCAGNKVSLHGLQFTSHTETAEYKHTAT